MPECVLNFGHTKVLSGKWPLDPLRHDWLMTRILRPKELVYSQSKIIPPGLLSTANIITPFWNIPPPNNKQGMNVGIACPQFLETIKFVDLIPTFPSILKILLEECYGMLLQTPSMPSMLCLALPTISWKCTMSNIEIENFKSTTSYLRG